MKIKKIFLIFHGRFPSNKAASLFTAKNAEAFADKGVEVIVIVPRLIGREKDNAYKYYGLKENFKIAYLPVIDIGTTSFLNRLRFVLSFLTFSISTVIYLLLKAKKEDIIYSNETLPLYLASLFFPYTFYEMHDFTRGYKWFYRSLCGILVTNKIKSEHLLEEFPKAKDKIIIERNAVSIASYSSITKKSAREALGLSFDEKYIVYTGHLYGWKGVDILAKSFSYLPSKTFIYFIGGTEEDVKKMQRDFPNTSNLIFKGHRPHDEIVLWQKAADVLVLPNTAKERISLEDTSPMKLFEYMASGTPIVASRIPSVTEILNEDNSYLVNPDNPEDLARGIKEVINGSDESKSAKAFSWVKEHTWDKRADRILQFINTRVSFLK